MDTNMVQTGFKGVPDLPNVLPGGAGGGSAAGSGFPLPKTEAQAPQPKPAAEQVAFDPKVSEHTRLEEMQRASQMMFREVFAVRDTKFAIYKDASGQFVTRFTNLRDGSISYIPEPDMMQYLESRGQARKALLKIDV